MNKSQSAKQKPRAIYNSMLAQYSLSLRTNKFARELALKYHKTKHKRPTFKTYLGNQNQSRWPIESNLFNRVLSEKLNRVLPRKHVLVRKREVIEKVFPLVKTKTAMLEEKSPRIRINLTNIVIKTPCVDVVDSKEQTDL